MGGVVYAIVCKKKVGKNTILPKIPDVKQCNIENWNVGKLEWCFEYDEYTDMGTNYVPMKELGKLGEEALKKIPGVTEDTLVCVNANFLKWRPESK